MDGLGSIQDLASQAMCFQVHRQRLAITTPQFALSFKRHDEAFVGKPRF